MFNIVISTIIKHFFYAWVAWPEIYEFKEYKLVLGNPSTFGGVVQYWRKGVKRHR